MNKPVETILILGNGFDLSQKRKTSYSDFLDFLTIASNFLWLYNKRKQRESYSRRMLGSYSETGKSIYDTDYYYNYIQEDFRQVFEQIIANNVREWKEHENWLEEEFLTKTDLFLYSFFDKELKQFIREKEEKGYRYRSSPISFVEKTLKRYYEILIRLERIKFLRGRDGRGDVFSLYENRYSLKYYLKNSLNSDKMIKENQDILDDLMNFLDRLFVADEIQKSDLDLRQIISWFVQINDSRGKGRLKSTQNNKILSFIEDNRTELGQNWSNLEQVISDLANALNDIKENISDYESYLVNHSSELYDIKQNLENFAIQNKVDIGNLLIQLDQLHTNSDIGISNFPHQTNPMAYAFMLGEIRRENGEDRPLQSVIEAVNEKLISDLEELTVWLEFYLTYLDEVDKDKEKTAGTVLDEIAHIKESKVINFNYTDTIRKFGVKEENIHFIHGRLNFDRSHFPINQMVFGIEDKDSDLETINVDLIPYQKFYQRVVKETGNQYETFFNTDANKNIVIFGHSVDPLDKEIFQNCFDLADKGGNEYRFIFAYYNEEDKRSMAKNLALILGKNRFITLTGQRKLVFVQTTDLERMREYLLS